MPGVNGWNSYTLSEGDICVIKPDRNVMNADKSVMTVVAVSQ